jgi:D-sedoheptulose 7-phosphate isomerase
MQNDTKFRNQNFSMTSISDYLEEYSRTLWTAMKEVDRGQLEIAARVLNNARGHGLRIFSCGNGGSAAIAQHMECDLKKGCYFKDRSSLEVISLANNVPLITAIANDINYEEIFCAQLEMANIRDGEVLIMISSSGNSPNVLRACEWAKNNGMITIGMTGFDGGELLKQAAVRLHLPIKNYGIVEDCHQSLMHVISQFHELSLR